MINYSDFQLSFKNEHLIFERTVKCTIKDHEMGCTYNPSILISGSKENMLTFATGSEFMPYMTTVGLYNESNELLAVAKFAQPIPISPTTDTNIIIRMDI
jgi:spore coat protein CotF